MNAGQRGAVTIGNQHGRSWYRHQALVKGFANLEDFVLLVQNVMKAVVSITSFVDVQVVKEIQVSHNSTYLLKMIWWKRFGSEASERCLRTSQYVWWSDWISHVDTSGWSGSKNVSKEITTIPVNKSFNTMTSCVNNVRLSTSQRYDVITADRDLAPEIQAMIKRTIGRVVDGHARAKTRWKTRSNFELC